MKHFDVDYPADKNAKNAAKLFNEHRESLTAENIKNKAASAEGLFIWAKSVLILKGLIDENAPV